MDLKKKKNVLLIDCVQVLSNNIKNNIMTLKYQL